MTDEARDPTDDPDDHPDDGSEDRPEGGAPAGGDGRALWFGNRDGGPGLTPLTWQGRATLFLYGFLVLAALVTYSQLAVTAFVILFYTVVLVFVVVVKSDLLKEWPPRS